MFNCLSTVRASLRSFCIIGSFNMGQVKLSMDMCLIAIYLSLGKYKLLLFPHPC